MSDLFHDPTNGDIAARALRIEQTSLRAWPALTDSDFDGWRLRFANGYTRRANSITPLAGSTLAVDDKIATCERLYTERGLPTIFRVTPFADPQLDRLLDLRGYQKGDVVEVLAGAAGLALDQEPRSAAACVEPSGQATPRSPWPRGRAAGAAKTLGIKVRACGIETWLDVFERSSNAPAANRPAHAAILNTVPGLRRLLILQAGDDPVACGMAVVVDGLLGLFDLVTSPAHQNLGYGSRLVHTALRWGHRVGAIGAYLQVLEGNAGAKRIYDRHGLALLYRYHYRERRFR